MTLRAGVALSHHEVLGPLGAGAMGEIYRARDTGLGGIVLLPVPGQASDRIRVHTGRSW